MGLFNALFGKPPKRKSSTYADWHQPAAPQQPSVRNCKTGTEASIGFLSDRDCGNAEQFEIDPECGDAYNIDWEETDSWYGNKISLLKSQGRTFFVVSTFHEHCEGADVFYRICESREQMESVRKSYNDCSNRYVPHEFVLNVVNGQEVDTPPEWWTDYEDSFNKSEDLRHWQESGSSRYRL